MRNYSGRKENDVDDAVVIVVGRIDLMVHPFLHITAWNEYKSF
jgi:hypothetical protein